MSDIARESFCNWDGWDDLEYSKIISPLEIHNERDQSLDEYIHQMIGESIFVGIIKAMEPDSIWTWAMEQMTVARANDQRFVENTGEDGVVFRYLVFYHPNTKEQIQFILWVDDDEDKPNGLFFGRKSQLPLWKDFLGDMALYIDLG